MKSFPHAVRAAYKSTPLYPLDRLLLERSKWARRETIARNKLAKIERKLSALAYEYANQLTEKKP